VTRPIAIVIGILVGLAVGLVCERVPVRPIVQSIIAALVASTVASVASAAVWLMRPPPDAGVLAVSFGLSESLLTWAAVLLVGVVLHAAVGWIGPLLHPSVVAHRGVLIALLGALWGALACTSGIGMAGPLR
jgi:hypothetical protein